MKIVSTSACPHDCPSTCTIDIEHDHNYIYNVRGNKENSYTKGVICSKVSRYNQRTHHKKRLRYPMKRIGKKGSGEFTRISWDEAIDTICANFVRITEIDGSEAIWPYFYAGTMGLIQRDGINRLRHIYNYSNQYSTICNTLAQTGWIAGVGSLKGPDPREVKYSKVIIVWGGNPASTQVNFMKHVQNARKKNNALLIVIDPYLTKTAKISDMHIKLKPGTDGALACGIMKYLFENNKVDYKYMEKFSNGYQELRMHLISKSDNWASCITGVDKNTIEKLCTIMSSTKKVFFRLGYGFTRQRNGSFNMHAVTSISTVMGYWQHLGGGAFYSNGEIYEINKELIERESFKKKKIRELDQSRIGKVLIGDKKALMGGVEVKGLIIQNTNPLVVAPETLLLREGFSRKDLFVCVHEQFMTETAKYADILLPATSFVEHNDIYIAGGHQHLIFGPKIIKSIGEAWSNHKLINTLGLRLGNEDEVFKLSEEDMIDQTLKTSNLGNLSKLKQNKFYDLQPPFNSSHFCNGFGHPDGKFHFAAVWKKNDVAFNNTYRLPDHYPLIEETDLIHPFRLITAPAHSFLNTSFTEVEKSRKLEEKPKIKIHSKDIEKLKLKEGEIVKIGNKRASLKIHVESFDGLLEGVTVVEGIWPNEYFIEGCGINSLVGSDIPEPAGGAVFHDIAIWIKKLN